MHQEWARARICFTGAAYMGVKSQPGTYIVITPKVSWSSGIEGPAFQDGKPVIKKIIWEE